MSEWTPKPRRDAKMEDLSLTGEEGYVLSRIDGSTSVKSLVQLTGLPEGRVRQIVQKLVRQGAVEDMSAAPPPSGPMAGSSPTPKHSPAEVATAVDQLSREELDEILGEHTMDEDEPVDATMTQENEVQAAPSAERNNPEVQLDAPDDAPPPPDDAQAAENDEQQAAEAQDGDEAGKGDEDAEKSEKSEKSEEIDENEEANHRRLFNETLSKLEPPEREAMAKTAKDPELSALCFDPLPSVIKHVLENHATGFQQARLIARNHHTPQGLDHVMNRAEFFRDGQTQRLLLQNTMLQEPQLKKLLQTKRLADVYKVTISREIPERNRQKARHVLRSKWAVAEAEERAGLIFLTEGRCLIQLTGLPFDSRTTSLLCGKSYTSNLLIQNLARFGATPPPVLAHLLKQNAVRRQQMLKNLILQHPNCPADAKRKM
jgi:hypothetical protein